MLHVPCANRDSAYVKSLVVALKMLLVRFSHTVDGGRLRLQILVVFNTILDQIVEQRTTDVARMFWGYFLELWGRYHGRGGDPEDALTTLLSKQIVRMSISHLYCHTV